jgi:hypothetical protein
MKGCHNEEGSRAVVKAGAWRKGVLAMPAFRRNCDNRHVHVLRIGIIDTYDHPDVRSS